MDEPLDMNKLGKGRAIPTEGRKVGMDAFNDLAISHDAHAKEVERLQKELDELYITGNVITNKLKLVSEDGELLLECRVGDKYHQLLLEVGLNTILKRALSEYEFIPPDVSYDEFFEDEGGKE